VDLGGLFASTDLDERLKEKNNFKFLSGGAPPLVLENEYSFIVITDIHIEGGDAHGLENIRTAIYGVEPTVRFAVIGGDITQNGAEQDIKKFIEIARSLDMPVYPVIGNHDIYFGNWSVWKDLIGSTSYKVDGTNATLFILDSANGFLGKQQLDWLENELTNAHDKVFVFSHHNLFADSAVNIQQMNDTKEIARTVSLVSKKRGIMFTGHSHERLIKETNGGQFINIEDFVKNKTYCLVTVKGTSVTYEFKKL
jgi:predicted phosphodiesterase